MKNKKHAFTLIELIIVIIVLIILGTISFLGMQGYNSTARDAVRTSDIINVEKNLELFSINSGIYPNPTNYVNVTYSGGIAWKQGIFGSEPFNQLGLLNKLPLDPLTGTEYTYSITTNKKEYQLAAVYESYSSKNKDILNKTYADGNINGTSKLVGTYNGIKVNVHTGSIVFSIFTPTIISGDLENNDLVDILSRNKLVINGRNVLPYNYINTKFKQGTLNLGLTNGILISTGTITSTGYTDRLKEILRGSILINDPIFKNYITVEPNSCEIQLGYSGAIFTAGTPTSPNQSRQSSDSGSACYWTCGVGKVLVGDSCVSENCEGTTANGTSEISTATSKVGGTWNYSTTPGLCTYTCNEGYIRSGNECVIAPSCSNQPNYTNATFTIGTPTSFNQEWQSSNELNGCYWTCGAGKVLVGNNCVSETCEGVSPNGTSEVSTSTSTAGGTWNYSTTPGICTYNCNSGYLRANGSCELPSCTSQPNYSHVIFTAGNPTNALEPWQNTNPNNPCYYSCTTGYTGNDCSSECNYSYTKTTVGTTGSEPIGIVRDSAGNIYTANRNSNTVTKITPDGVSSTLGTTGSHPEGIAIDDNGNIYTANNGSNTVTKITPAGVSSTLGTTGSHPIGITVDSDGNVYTANNISNNVSKISQNGTSFIIGTTGSHPEGIALDGDGNIYTANNTSNNVTKITQHGVITTVGTTLIGTVFGTTGSHPEGIVIDDNGNVYVSNNNSDNITKITPSGVSSIFGSVGSHPNGIAIDKYGNIYVTSHSDKLYLFSTAGVSSEIGNISNEPIGITVDDNANVYISTDDNKVLKFSGSCSSDNDDSDDDNDHDGHDDNDSNDNGHNDNDD